ncbi:hypothetical protein OC834_005359 [Tilletia horrida]|nr:hypothetical protein OC834_005359 [Tilletia horrida]
MPVLQGRRIRPSLSVGFFNFIVKQQIPVVASQTLLIAEIIRKIHVDFRMGARAYARGRLNVSELLYFSIKLFALVAVILDCILQESTALGTPRACHATSTASTFLWYTSSTLVAAALAWRCYIIFGRSAMAMRLLVTGLMIQFIVTIIAVSKTHKYLAVSDGYCDYSPAQLMDLHRRWNHLASPWFVLVNFTLDAMVVTASTWKLVSSSRGPLGFSALAQVLIANGVQYAVLVCTTNLVEFILIATMYSKIPSLLTLSITIQIITGLNLIAEEQDAVHGYTRSTMITGRSRRGYASDKAVASPAPNRIHTTRDTGSVSGYGTATANGELSSKEAYRSMMSGDEGVIQMHTCVDVEVDSGRSDKSNGMLMEKPQPQLQSQPPAPLQPETQQQRPTTPLWEITMGNPVRRKPSPTTATQITARALSSQHPLAQQAMAMNDQEDRPHTAPGGFTAAAATPGHAMHDEASSVNNYQMPERSNPFHNAPATAVSSTLGGGSSFVSIPSSGGPAIGSGSLVPPSPATVPAAAAAAAAAANPPHTPLGGVSIRSIRQAMGNQISTDMAVFGSRPSSARGGAADPNWPTDTSGM